MNYPNNVPNPCYIVEEDLLRRNLSLIKSVAEQSGAEIILAFKAFALWKTFPIFREYISHSTASSLDEARLAYEEFGNKTHTYSPAYERQTIDELIGYSRCITFNSLSQYTYFADKVKEHTEVSWGLRVNPEYSEIETELYNPCAPGSRFGVLSDSLPEELPEGIEGLHIHCHCESGADTFVRTLQHIEDKFSKWFKQISWINFGGGHLMTRKDYDTKLLIDTITDFRKRYPWLKVILEPGSAFAWQTGPLLSRITDVVENNGVRTAILNVSFTCHMPDCLEMPYQPVIRNARMNNNGPFVYKLGGNSCLSGDVMGEWSFDKELKVGDEIIFEDMIHYTTVKTNTFNGVRHPSIGILHSDGKFELLRKYEYEDYKARMC